MRHYLAGTCSFAEPRRRRLRLARFGLLGISRRCYPRANLGAAITRPAAFAACRQLGVNPRHVLSVGDWLEGDVIAATCAGLTAIWLDRGVDPVA